MHKVIQNKPLLRQSFLFPMGDGVMIAHIFLFQCFGII